MNNEICNIRINLYNNKTNTTSSQTFKNFKIDATDEQIKAFADIIDYFHNNETQIVTRIVESIIVDNREEW